MGPRNNDANIDVLDAQVKSIVVWSEVRWAPPSSCDAASIVLSMLAHPNTTPPAKAFWMQANKANPNRLLGWFWDGKEDSDGDGMDDLDVCFGASI